MAFVMTAREPPQRAWAIQPPVAFQATMPAQFSRCRPPEECSVGADQFVLFVLHCRESVQLLEPRRARKGRRRGFRRGRPDMIARDYSFGKGEKWALTIFQLPAFLTYTSVVRPQATIGAPPPLGNVIARS